MLDLDLLIFKGTKKEHIWRVNVSTNSFASSSIGVKISGVESYTTHLLLENLVGHVPLPVEINISDSDQRSQKFEDELIFL